MSEDRDTTREDSTKNQIRRLITSAKTLDPAQAITTLEEAVSLAEQGDYTSLAIDARIDLGYALRSTGQIAQAMLNSAALGQAFDQYLDDLNDDQIYGILTQQVWTICDALLYPQVSLEQIQAALDEFRSRMDKFEEGLEPVRQVEFFIQSQVYGVSNAERQFSAWINEPQTLLSDCETCQINIEVDYYTQIGEYDKALEVGAPLLIGDNACEIQPMRLQASMIQAAVETENLDFAADLFSSAWHLVRDYPTELVTVSKLLVATVRTGQFDRGLELFETAINQVENEDPSTTLDFFSSAVALLRACENAGIERELTLGDTTYSISEANSKLTQIAEELAGEFDQRNGTTVRSDAIHALWAPAPVTTLPLVELPTADDIDFQDLATSKDPHAPKISAIPQLSVTELLRAIDSTSRYGDQSFEAEALKYWDDNHGQFELENSDDLIAAAWLDWMLINKYGVQMAIDAKEKFLRAEYLPGMYLADYEIAIWQRRIADADQALAKLRSLGTTPELALALIREYPDQSEQSRIDQLKEALSFDLDERFDVWVSIKAAEQFRLGALTGEDLAELCERILADLPAQDHLPTKARYRIRLGKIAVSKSDYLAAIGHLKSGIEQAEYSGTVGILSSAYLQLGNSYAAIGAQKYAEKYLKKALSLALKLDDLEQVVSSYTALAEFYRQLRRPAVSEVFSQAGIDYLNEHSDQEINVSIFAAHMLSAARNAEGFGEIERAIEYLTQVESAAESTSNHNLLIQTKFILARVKQDGDPVESTSVYRQIIEICERTGDIENLLNTARTIPWSILESDGPEAAVAATRKAIARNDQAEANQEIEGWDYTLERFRLTDLLAEMLINAKDYEQAAKLLADLPETIVQQYGIKESIGARFTRGRLRLQLGAENAGFSDLSWILENADPTPEQRTFIAEIGAFWLEEQGRSDDAAKYWKQVTGEEPD